MSHLDSRMGGEDGTVTVFVVGLTVALLAVAGLVYDGGRLLAARRQTHAVAGNAARAAAQAVDLDRLRATGTPEVNLAGARGAAHNYLDRVGHTGTVAVSGGRVQVTVSRQVSLVILSAVGLQQRTVAATGHANLVRGVTRPDQDSR